MRFPIPVQLNAKRLKIVQGSLAVSRALGDFWLQVPYRPHAVVIQQ
jgi:hypothetical protein